jgi:hypothetical protein
MIRAARKDPGLLIGADEANDWADASLMAAAPDLYAACEEVRTWLEDESFNDLDDLSDDCKDLLATIKAALSKARGEES